MKKKYLKYKLVNSYDGTKACIKNYDTENGVYKMIPYCEDNVDYQEYLKWVAEGNTPEEAD